MTNEPDYRALYEQARGALEAVTDMADEMWCALMNEAAGQYEKPVDDSDYNEAQLEIRESYPYENISKTRAALAPTDPAPGQEES